MLNLIKMWKTVTECKSNNRKIKELKYDEININEYIVIDVRSRREFKESHLKGALNIPLPEIKKNIEKFIKDKTKKILIYCEYGGRSAKAVKILEEIGYINVYNLKGGLENI